jgi:peptidoglycan/LPS O-acetylase OafA/YrhL
MIIKRNDNNRDVRIDILRAIAIICIIIAHSEPESGLVYQLRNFDVVLMVFLLGISFSISTGNKKIEYYQYVLKRFNRLIIPTWIFLIIFLLVFFVISLLRHEIYYFDHRMIISSFLLLGGIGYVWIMRVFFIIALICPFVLKLSNKVESNIVFLVGFLISWLIYLLLLFFDKHLFGNLEYIYRNFILYGVGYGLIAAFGIRFKRFSNQQIIGVTICVLLVLIGFCLFYHFAPTQKFKYPPSIYYLSYGLLVSLILYQILSVRFIRSLLDNRFILFLSQASAWIYFWHIIFIYIVKIIGPDMPLIASSSIRRFVFIFCSALIVTYFHELIKGSIKNRRSAVVANDEKLKLGNNSL